MSEEIYLNTGTSFQQPYIARVPANAQTPATGQAPARQPLSGQTPFTYQHRAPATYSNPVSYRVPVVAQATGTTPVEANSQTPYTAQARQPARTPAGYQVPFTYDARYPARYIANARQPHANPVSAQQPARYIASARQPFANPVSAQQPFANPVNAQQPFANPVNAQQPFANPVSYANPVVGTTTVPAFEAEIATDFQVYSLSPYTTQTVSGWQDAYQNYPFNFPAYGYKDFAGTQAGNTSTAVGLNASTANGNTYTQMFNSTAYNYYGVSNLNYNHYVMFIVTRTYTAWQFELAIANTGNQTYNASSANALSNLKIWLPSNWPRPSTPDLTLNVSNATLTVGQRPAYINAQGTTVNHQAITFHWAIGNPSNQSVYFGTQSNANAMSQGYYNNGIYRFELI